MAGREGEIGALWKGEKVISGTIDLDKIEQTSGVVRIVVFQNKYAKDKQPTHRIFISKPREEQDEAPF